MHRPRVDTLSQCWSVATSSQIMNIWGVYHLLRDNLRGCSDKETFPGLRNESIGGTENVTIIYLQ